MFYMLFNFSLLFSRKRFVLFSENLGLSGGDHFGNRRIELVGNRVLDGGRECIDGGLILVETRGGALKGQLHICIHGEGRHRRSAKWERRLDGRCLRPEV